MGQTTVSYCYITMPSKRYDQQLMRINLSSDIIESTSDIYTGKTTPNKLHGVTSFVLTM